MLCTGLIIGQVDLRATCPLGKQKFCVILSPEYKCIWSSKIGKDLFWIRAPSILHDFSQLHNRCPKSMNMKTPQGSCTSPIGHFKVHSPHWSHVMMSHDGMTSYCDVTWRPDITPKARLLYHAIQIKKVSRTAQKSHFLTQWPWPLTYGLDHQTCPRYGSVVEPQI